MANLYFDIIKYIVTNVVNDYAHVYHNKNFSALVMFKLGQRKKICCYIEKRVFLIWLEYVHMHVQFILKIEMIHPRYHDVRNHCKLGYQMKLIFFFLHNLTLGQLASPQTRIRTFIKSKVIMFL